MQKWLLNMCMTWPAGRAMEIQTIDGCLCRVMDICNTHQAQAGELSMINGREFIVPVLECLLASVFNGGTSDAAIRKSFGKSFQYGEKYM